MRRRSPPFLAVVAIALATAAAADAALVDLTGPATTYDLAVDAATTRIDGPSPDAGVGRDVALADVNGDGTLDLAVTEGDDVRVVFGPGRSVVDLAGLTPDGFAIVGGQGGQVDAIGDVNGDGRDDLAVRTHTTDYRVVFGQTGAEPIDVSAGPGQTGFRIRTGEESLQLAAAGDVNGDGRGDIVLKEGIERAFVVFGKGGKREADLDDLGGGGFEILRGNGQSGFFSGLVAPAGDVNGDGLADVLVSDLERGHSTLELPGYVYVVFGKRSTDPVSTFDLAAENAGYEIVGARDFDQIGIGLANAGDVDGDGVPDQLIGKSWSATGRGATVAVVFGKRANRSTIELDEAFPGYEILLPAGGALSALAGEVDVDGDGHADQVIGDGTSRRGVVHVVLGKRDRGAVDLDTAADVIRIEGPSNGADFGQRLAALMRQGRPQLLVGAPGAAPNGAGSGAAHLLDDGVARPTAPPPIGLIAFDPQPRRSTAGAGAGQPTLTLHATAPLSLELELLRLVPGKRVGPKRQRCQAPARAGARDRPCVRPTAIRRVALSLPAARELALPLRGRLPAGAYVVSVRITDQAGRLYGPYRGRFAVAP